MELKDIYGLDHQTQEPRPTHTREESKSLNKTKARLQENDDCLPSLGRVVQGTPMGRAVEAAANNNLQKSEINMRSKAKTISGIQEEGKQAVECTVCYTNPVTILAYPCCHLCLCQDCTRVIMKADKKCPICRNIIMSTVKIQRKED